MMPATIAPSIEAMQAITDRINSGTAYELDLKATYSEQLVDPLEEIVGLRVDVCSESEEQLIETCDLEDNTRHIIRVWIRKKLQAITPDEIDPLKLLCRQIFQRLNNFRSSNGRVMVFDIENDVKPVPDKTALHTSRLFVASVYLVVEVEPSP
jgi:hypothetical protein